MDPGADIAEHLAGPEQAEIPAAERVRQAT
jgi:hypothetical protein